MKICPHCGSSVMEDANFCPRCGTDLRPEGMERPATPLPDSLTPLGASFPQSEQDTFRKNERSSDEETRSTRPVSSGLTNPDPATETSALSALSGLLDPVGVSSKWGDELSVLADRRVTAIPAADELRRVRYRMLQEPTLAPLVQPIPPSHGVYRVYWIFGVLLLSLLIPFLLPNNGPMQVKQSGAGAFAAYNAIQGLPDHSDVLIFWAYDPATAGEMDQIAYPVIRHLLQRGQHMTIVTLLPGGVTTAQRLIAQVEANKQERKQGNSSAISQRISLHFVPGGFTALPWIGRATCSNDRCRPMAHEEDLLTDSLCPANGCNFVLTLVIAAQVEDGQQWLEIAQPLNTTKVVLVSSASANLPLQPYLESGQLVGLLGGFDGAANYLQSGSTLLSDAEWSGRWQTLYQLRWGHIALLVVIFLGNLVALGGTPGSTSQSATTPGGEVGRNL